MMLLLIHQPDTQGDHMKALMVVLIGLAIVGQFDVEEENRQEREYCSMVSAGHWPAYREDVTCN